MPTKTENKIRQPDSEHKVVDKRMFILWWKNVLKFLETKNVSLKVLFHLCMKFIIDENFVSFCLGQRSNVRTSHRRIR